MAPRALNCVEKRDLLHDSKSSADLVKAGESYFAAGSLTDALHFFLRAEHEDGVRRIRDHAIEHGDAFLLEQLVLAGKEVGTDEWRTLADNARERGKNLFAVRALRAAGDTEESDRLAEEIGAKKSPRDEAAPGGGPTAVEP